MNKAERGGSKDKRKAESTTAKSSCRVDIRNSGIKSTSILVGEEDHKEASEHRDKVEEEVQAVSHGILHPLPVVVEDVLRVKRGERGEQGEAVVWGKGGKEGGREGGKEGRREGGKEGRREGGRKSECRVGS